MKNKFFATLKKITNFLINDMWIMGDKNLSFTKTLMLNFLKKIILSVKGFFKSELTAKSASLSFYSIMSLVPILAIIIAVGRGFGMSEKVDGFIAEALKGQSELVPYITDFVNNYLLQVSGGVFLGVGVLFLLWTVISTFIEVEYNFNKIWNVERSRSFFQQFTTYITLILLVPVLISLASGFSIYVNNEMNSVLGHYYSPFYNFLMKIAPYFFYWLLFAVIYFIVPNAKVKFIHALFAGVICGTIFQLFQYLYISGQINLSRYNSVYGTFAAIPLFFFWLQISWLILLYGAELSFVSQNLKDKYYEYEKNNISRRFIDFVIVLVSKEIIKNFKDNLPPISAETVANKNNIPIRLINDAISVLIKVKIVYEIVDDKNNRTFVPAMDINQISIGLILDKLEKLGKENYSIEQEPNNVRIWEIIKDIKDKTALRNQDILLKDL